MLGDNMNQSLRFVCCCLLATFGLSSAAVAGDDPVLAEAAPKDCNAPMNLETMHEIVEKLSPDALKTWPSAKKRFLAGLPERHSLFVTMLVAEATGESEYLFIAVDEIRGDKIRGRVWNDVKVVKNLYPRAPIEIPEAAMSDWLISKPDGSE